jgi:glutamine phosphoribosylpyrophosphate amidotransferase
LPSNKENLNPFLTLTSCAFQLDITDEENVMKNFKMVDELLLRLEVDSLDYEKSEEGLAKALDKVSRELKCR